MSLRGARKRVLIHATQGLLNECARFNVAVGAAKLQKERLRTECQSDGARRMRPFLSYLFSSLQFAAPLTGCSFSFCIFFSQQESLIGSNAYTYGCRTFVLWYAECFEACFVNEHLGSSICIIYRSQI